MHGESVRPFASWASPSRITKRRHTCRQGGGWVQGHHPQVSRVVPNLNVPRRVHLPPLVPHRGPTWGGHEAAERIT
jgi:hypothetical protein